MKCQVLFSLKIIKKLDCHLLQILLGALRVKMFFNEYPQSVFVEK